MYENIDIRDFRSTVNDVYGTRDHSDPGRSRVMIDKLDYFLSTIDGLLDTGRKRHFFGGLLMSMAFLFGGMSITVMTVKEDKREQTDY